jgi:hypothetical protein
MKKIILAVLILSAVAYSQETPPPGFHTHDGFYLSMGIGPGFGDIKNEATNYSYRTAEYSGIGGQFDFRIGGTIADNLILSFDAGGRSILSPELAIDGTTLGTAEDITITDVIMGVGLTYYFMPSNIFISGTIGWGSFTVQVMDYYHSGSTKPGLGLQFKFGKEWWVSTDWGLGIAGGIAYAAADDKTILFSSYHGKFSTTRLFLLFNATYN